MNISRKKIIFILFFITLFAVLIWFFAFLSKTERNEILKTTKNLFPFGEILSLGTETNITEQGSQESNTTEQETIEDINRVPEKKLRLVSDFPTGGFTGFSRIEEEVVVSNEIDENGILIKQEQIIETENQYIRYSSILESNVFESKISPYSIQSEKIIDNYIPNTEKAIFSDNGKYVLFQYWDNEGASIESYLGSIEKIRLDIEPCPFGFNEKITLGSQGNAVSDVHKFLNRNPRTTIAKSGINSPGNEGSVALETTIIAIKNFQSLHELDIDGVTGPATRSKMKDICNDQQLILAEKEFSERDEKYRISGRFLPENIVSADINPQNNIIFYLQNLEKGSRGVIQNLQTEARQTIFASPLKEIYTQWNSENSIEISTKPSYQAPTYTYSMDAISGDYHKSLPHEYGMTTKPSPNNEKTFVSKIQNNQIINSIYTYKINNEITLDMNTFADKCVWSRNNIDLYCAVPGSLTFGEQYPDSWYQGLELYTDSLYKINTETGEQNLISDVLTDYNESIDVSSIDIDAKDEYLYFIDKDTEFLWSYRLFDL